MMDLDFQKDLEKINCRVLVLCGEKDKVNMSATIELKQQINHAELKIIPHAGHEINKDNPVELGKILSNFIDVNDVKLKQADKNVEVQ